jgi:hypothetical protein
MRMQSGISAMMRVSAVVAALASAGVAAAADACQLLTAAQVSSALGVEVDPGSPSIPNHPEHCIWREHGKEQALAKNLQLSLLTDRQYEMGKTALPNIPKTPESGIGDEAYFAKTPGIGFILTVKKGSTYFRVQARPIPGFSHNKGTAAEEQALDERYKSVERTIAHEVLKKI